MGGGTTGKPIAAAVSEYPVTREPAGIGRTNERPRAGEIIKATTRKVCREYAKCRLLGRTVSALAAPVSVAGHADVVIARCEISARFDCPRARSLATRSVFSSFAVGHRARYCSRHGSSTHVFASAVLFDLISSYGSLTYFRPAYVRV